MARTTVAAGILTIALIHGHSQPAAQQSFEVASIRPHMESVTVSGSSISGTRATWTAETLMNLISEAYLLNNYQISGGPRWTGSDHFDIVAKAADDVQLTKEQVRAMLQALLADRFQLKVHRESKEMSVYTLVTVTNEPKLNDPDTTHPGMRTVANARGVHITAWQGTMKQLADQLSVTAGRPVLDRTGLAGTYAYTLNFALFNSQDTQDPDIPLMTTAVEEQLGLRLDSRRASIEVLVVDSAEEPSAN